MKSTNVKAINEAVNLQAMRGTRNVRLDDGQRVIGARTVKGQLQAKTFNGWVNVASVNID